MLQFVGMGVVIFTAAGHLASVCLYDHPVFLVVTVDRIECICVFILFKCFMFCYSVCSRKKMSV